MSSSGSAGEVPSPSGPPSAPTSPAAPRAPSPPSELAIRMVLAEFADAVTGVAALRRGLASSKGCGGGDDLESSGVAGDNAYLAGGTLSEDTATAAASVLPKDLSLDAKNMVLKSESWALERYSAAAQDSNAEHYHGRSMST